jgi:hypothetical protein
VGTWEVRRAGGKPVAGVVFDDRVRALAHALTLRTGDGGEVFGVHGPDEPACATGTDLYRRLVAEGRRMRGAGRSLGDFLHGWLLVGRRLARRDAFTPDEVAAMVTAAGAVRVGEPDPAWRTAELDYVEEPDTFADWEAIVLSQLADLADLADRGPLDDVAYHGLDAPRPQGCRRATVRRWYNFDPAVYLECGGAGTLRGWDEDGGVRVAVPGPVLYLRSGPVPGDRPVATLGWDVLAELARCGQEYE